MSGVLAALAQELGTDPESLRDALFAGDESLQPTYLTVNAAGQVTAVFTGHVQAGGLDIIADDNASVNKSDRKIRWHQIDYNGTVVAEIIGSSLTGVPNINTLLSRVPSAGLARAVNQLQAYDDFNGAPTALFQVGVDLTTGKASIIYQVESSAFVSYQGTLIDSDSKSDFLLLSTTVDQVAVPPTTGKIIGEDWHIVGNSGEPAFLSGNFVQYTTVFGGGAQSPVGFRKDPLGVVHLEGMVGWNNAAGSGASAAVYQLPVGYRANGSEFFTCASQTTAGTAFQTVYVRILGGLVTIFTAVTGVGSWFDLSGITFRASA